jgi:L-lactate dehydrogenase complex protein LldG
MNLTANKRVVARFFELLNAGAHDEAVSLFTNDFIWSIPESIPGGGEKSADLADVDVAVVRAVLGVAESGSVLFTEAELKVNACLSGTAPRRFDGNESAIVSGLQEAYTHPVFQTARYAVFHTGPSATGDIEGVLIHGAQGVRSLTVIVDG